MSFENHVNGVANGASMTNYAAFLSPTTKAPRIGHLDLDTSKITPLSHASGTPITNLYEVIEVGEANIIALEQPILASEVKLLAPIAGRDILAVGKNYAVSMTLYCFGCPPLRD